MKYIFQIGMAVSVIGMITATVFSVLMMLGL